MSKMLLQLFLLLILLVVNVLSKPRIIGGSDCPEIYSPYMVFILYTNGKVKHFLCCGTIVSKLWVLSAAHCFHSTNHKYYKIGAGISNRFDLPNSQLKKVATIVIHDQFKKTTLCNDIAMVRVMSPFKIDGVHTKLVNLPKLEGPEQFEERYNSCIVQGWGMTKIDSFEMPEELQCVTLPIVSTKICKEYLEALRVYEVNTTTTICTMYEPGGRDACIGDSGGPLICNYIQEGIVSWGYQCAKPNMPAVQTRVDKYLTWIDHVIKNIKPKIDTYESDGSSSLENIFITLALDIIANWCYSNSF